MCVHTVTAAEIRLLRCQWEPDGKNKEVRTT